MNRDCWSKIQNSEIDLRGYGNLPYDKDNS